MCFFLSNSPFVYGHNQSAHAECWLQWPLDVEELLNNILTYLLTYHQNRRQWVRFSLWDWGCKIRRWDRSNRGVINERIILPEKYTTSSIRPIMIICLSLSTSLSILQRQRIGLLLGQSDADRFLEVWSQEWTSSKEPASRMYRKKADAVILYCMHIVHKASDL